MRNFAMTLIKEHGMESLQLAYEKADMNFVNLSASWNCISFSVQSL